jgi:hypothetical protein
VYPEGQTGLPAGRPRGGFEGPPTPERSRAVIFEPHPAVRAVLEYLLTREGYSVEASGDTPLAREGPALMLVAAGDGLYVFESRDAAETLETLDPGTASSFETMCGVTGIQAFVPKPFGAGDVLRVVRVVRGFDGRRRPRSRTA